MTTVSRTTGKPAAASTRSRPVLLVPPQPAGAGSAVNSVTRQVGGALGVAMAGSILSGVHRDRMADAELPGTTQGLSPAAEERARTSAEAARSPARRLTAPARAGSDGRPRLARRHVRRPALRRRPRPHRCAVAVVGLRTRAASEGREQARPSDAAREGQTR
ncbi:hypothetical protein ACSCB1_26410 [Streptomyces europaeiscabiei]|uniref:MFS transporter n=1 Tax=Streptomyces europaeiscabiei TaxID=146819 RepID=A0ABU4NH87_9ACTN|nr:hypothetical protein [Streptomyces europaeiscabiei]MDX2529541.1 hypothetical protein [Streptomyces europaeiscabiei]MDX2757829.1 hypothetical protein [Streptomyces europaeiscabiei]MDX3543721.1 hypothetical protein [Streptomyces europaeiscabiei]MDX3553442.1 hypothetical protein [Streptomyces europaeiscabiei]MDX3701654.1 hypothetical protein [Streptomyces europaeiscabiei]